MKFYSDDSLHFVHMNGYMSWLYPNSTKCHWTPLQEVQGWDEITLETLQSRLNWTEEQLREFVLENL